MGNLIVKLKPKESRTTLKGTLVQNLSDYPVRILINEDAYAKVEEVLQETH